MAESKEMSFLHTDMELVCGDADDPVTNEHVLCTFVVHVATDQSNENEGGMPVVQTFVLRCTIHKGTFIITGNDLRVAEAAAIYINTQEKT